MEIDYSYGTDMGKFYVSKRWVTDEMIYETKRFISEEVYREFVDKLADIKIPKNYADGVVPRMLHLAAKNLYATSMGFIYDPENP